MKNLKITPPKGYEVDNENSTFDHIVFKEVGSLMDKVYTYHNTTQEKFDKLYENLPKHVKSFEKECMVVAYYNKNWIPDFNNTNEKKWYAWFYLNNFRLCGCDCCGASSDVPARLLFKNEADLREAIELYKDVFKESRLS